MKKGNSKLNIVITSIVAVILVISAITLIKLFCVDNNGISTLLSDVTDTQKTVEKYNKDTETKISESTKEIEDAISNSKKNTNSNVGTCPPTGSHFNVLIKRSLFLTETSLLITPYRPGTLYNKIILFRS